jgi:hypothetical protein
MKIEFIVPGPLMGYKQTTAKTMFHPTQRARSKAYGEFKTRVLLLSMEAGLPNMGIALKERAPKFSVQIFWKREPRIDFKNVYGSLEDSIWYQDDRYVLPGCFSQVTWDSGREEAKVIVELPDKPGSGVRGSGK